MKKKYVVGAFGCAAVAATVYAADHADTPDLISVARHDGRISDLHAWRSGDQLILSLCTNPNIPVGASYKFPEDLTLRMHIDNRSEVSFADSTLNAKYGGSLVDPAKVAASITYEFSFDASGAVHMVTEGLATGAESRMQVYAGLRDDPFINGLRNGRNVGCVVVQQPLADAIGTQGTLLVWATSKVPEFNGPISEHGGRALRSQFPEHLALNTLRPRAHFTELGAVPDLVIMNLMEPSGYPNGRLLTDDVIDLVGDPRLTLNPIAQAPTENDKPFSATFPYLADPH